MSGTLNFIYQEIFLFCFIFHYSMSLTHEQWTRNLKRVKQIVHRPDSEGLTPGKM